MPVDVDVDGQREMSVKEMEMISTCFICNGQPFTPQRATPPTSASSPTRVKLTKAIFKVWELPFAEEDQKEPNASLEFCRKCYKTVKQVYRIVRQLETLGESLHKMKLEIQDTIKSALTSIDSVSENNLRDMDGPINVLRNRIVGNSSNQRHYKHSVLTPSSIVIPVKVKKPKHLPKKQKREKVIPDSEVGVEKVNWSNTQLGISITGETKGGIDYANLKLITNPNRDDSSKTSHPIPKVSDEVTKRSSDDGGLVDSLLQSEREEVMLEANKCPLNRLKCSKCQYWCKDKLGRDAHIKKVHEGCEYPFCCPTCKKTFKTRRQFRIHDMGHKNEFPFICEHCNKGFRTQALLCFHLKNKHHGSREFKCNHCEKSFSTKAKLKIHETTHSKEYSINCSTCGKGFNNEISLKAHMLKHVKVSQWECSICDKLFSCSSALKSHMPSHTQQYKFKCSICPSGSPSQSALDRHMLSHGTEKGFECTICGRKLKFQRSLQKHLQIHANEKNFQCSLCEKKFIDKYKLMRHTKIHEGNKPFECNLCQRRFYTKYYLGSHLKFHEKQAAKEQVALLVLKDRKRCKRSKIHKKNQKKAYAKLRDSEDRAEETITDQEVVTSLMNVEMGNQPPISIPPITSSDIFSGVFEFTYQEI